LVWALFHSCMMFDTVENGLRYRKALVDKGKGCPTILVISDNSVIDSSGFVSAEKRVHPREMKNLLGQIPIIHSPGYKKGDDLRIMMNRIKSPFMEADMTAVLLQEVNSNVESSKQKLSELFQQERQLRL